MGFLRSKGAIARRKIHKLDVSAYVKKAQELFGLRDQDVHATIKEYQHFLYLLFWNREKQYHLPVVPTERADMLWHAHLLFNAEYNPFCEDVFGEIIFHRPGLEKGSDAFTAAVLHTRSLHDQVGYDGFDEDYFSFVEQQQSGGKKKPDNSGGCSGGATKGMSSDGDSGASCGSSCGGGCGGGCGG